MIGLVILSGLLVLVVWYAGRRVVDIQDLSRNLAAMTQDRNGFREGYLAACQAEQDLAADRDGAVALLREVRALAAQELERAKATAMTFFRALKAEQRESAAKDQRIDALEVQVSDLYGQRGKLVQQQRKVLDECATLRLRIEYLGLQAVEQEQEAAEQVQQREADCLALAQDQELALAYLVGALQHYTDHPTGLVGMAAAVQDRVRGLLSLCSQRATSITHLQRVVRRVTAQRDQAEARATQATPEPRPYFTASLRDGVVYMDPTDEEPGQ